MWGRFKDRLYWWYLFSKTRVIINLFVKLGSGVIRCTAYIFVLFIVIIWLFLAGRRT